MGRKLLIGTISSIALLALLGKGAIVYLHSSCDQFRIFEPPCSSLLTTAQTEALLGDRQGAVAELMKVRPGQIIVASQPQSRCSGKSLIVIVHPSENDCDALNEIIRRDFSDIPYKIING
ncbi:MAG: hypothetical protein WBB01_20465 [Phormidesmis sp.]